MPRIGLLLLVVAVLAAGCDKFESMSTGQKGTVGYIGGGAIDGEK